MLVWINEQNAQKSEDVAGVIINDEPKQETAENISLPDVDVEKTVKKTKKG